MSTKATIEPRNPKGMRDFLPAEKRVRDAVLRKMIETFESYGFDPLETPPVELKETLAGKIGAEEKLIYQVASKGDTEMALRYDLTVPLARVVAQYPDLPKPFKRYQIGSSYRGENTQKGRYRQFLQVDLDTIGSSSALADAEIIAAALRTYKKLGLKVKMLVNSKELLLSKISEAGIPEDLKVSVSGSIDKIMKIGKAGVVAEIEAKGVSADVAEKVFSSIKTAEPDQRIKELLAYLSVAGFKDGVDYQFDPFLARGLDYYTGTVFEADAEGYTAGSVGGGGRYDNLIGNFSGQSLPAVGFSFGFDRTLEALGEQGLLPEEKSSALVLVTVFDQSLSQASFQLAQALRESVPTELYTGEGNLEKQLKYADLKSIPYVAILGPKENAEKKVTIKNLAAKTQQTLSLPEAIKILT